MFENHDALEDPMIFVSTHIHLGHPMTPPTRTPPMIDVPATTPLVVRDAQNPLEPARIYLYIYLSVCLSVCLSIYLFIYQSINLSIYLSIYLSI